MVESQTNASQGEVNSKSPALESLNHVESLLNELLLDLSKLEPGLTDRSNDRAYQLQDLVLDDHLKDLLEAFKTRTLTIRRIMHRFRRADLPTRRYLRDHLDEEFAALKAISDSLREQFTSPPVLRE